MASASALSMPVVHRRKRRGAQTMLLYALVMLHEFRWTLAALGAMILVGTPLYHFTPRDQFSGRPSLLTSVYGAWTAMLAQPIVELPRSSHLVLLQALYPVFGFILIGEGVVPALSSRRARTRPPRG